MILEWYGYYVSIGLDISRRLHDICYFYGAVCWGVFHSTYQNKRCCVCNCVFHRMIISRQKGLSKFGCTTQLRNKDNTTGTTTHT